MYPTRRKNDLSHGRCSMRTHQTKATGNADHSSTDPTIDQDMSSRAS